MNFADWVWRHHFLKENGHDRAEALHETDIRMLEHCVLWHRTNVGRVFRAKQSACACARASVGACVRVFVKAFMPVYVRADVNMHACVRT